MLIDKDLHPTWITECSSCGDDTVNFMWIEMKDMQIALCQVCWIKFTDTAPIEVLNGLIEDRWCPTNN